MQVSLRQETLSQVFSAILKFSLCSQYFEKKDYPQRFFICNIKDSENVVRKVSKKSFFRGVFNKQHGGRAQKLLKSASQHLYHMHRYCDAIEVEKVSLIDMPNLGLLVDTLAAEK